jgi:L-lactate dehydrogenase complex protein LldF
VKIDIHAQLLKWRQDITAAGHAPWWKTLAMHGTSFVLKRPALYALAGRLARRFTPLANFLKLDPWTQNRDLPDAPKESFREWMAHQKNSR